MRPGEVCVWDPFVRVLHWSLVLLCAAAWITAEKAEAAHEALGLAVVGIVTMRLLWGWIGTRHARFANFVRPPAAALHYLAGLVRGRSQRYVGHNPAGALSILALLASLTLVAATGWASAHGPMAGAHWLEEVHEVTASLFGALVALHLAGVVASSLAGGENLVRAMITGKKRGS